MPKVSIIIPVYNAQDYLAKCLDSVVNQTLEDIEIICVNDCSTDNSIEILNEYAKKDSRIKVIDCKSNGGESKARNIGLDNATGEYLAFVDNDDTVDLDFYEKLYNLATEKKLDIAKADCYEIDLNNNKIEQEDNANIRNNDKYAFVTHWWTAIYNKKIIDKNNIRFKEDIILGGDIIFLNDVLVYSTTFDVIDGTYYYHYQRENSGDSQFLTFEKVQSAIKSYKTIIENLTQNYPNNVSKIGYVYAITYYLIAILSKIEKNNSTETIELCINSVFDLLSCIKESIIIEKKLSNIYPQIIYFYLKNDRESLLNLFQENFNLSQIQFITFKHKIKLLEGAQ